MGTVSTTPTTSPGTSKKSVSYFYDRNLFIVLMVILLITGL